MITITAYRTKARSFKTGTAAYIWRWFKVGKWIVFHHPGE